MTLRFIALFPGQGSQYPGMSKKLHDEFPWTKQIYEEASDSLKEDLYGLCADGSESDLQLTRNAQPAILVTAYAWFQVLRRELDIRAAAGAGHSLGEYTALLASGALKLGAAAALVRTRGEFMQSAVPEGKGKMAAILGMADDVVVALCEKATQGEHSLVVPANFNAPLQVVIAGHAEAVDRAQSLTASDPAFKARKVIPLKVSAPFHCPLMKPVAVRFESHLKSVAWSKPVFPIAFNVDGKLRSEPEIVPLLTEQIDHSVRWTDCVKALEVDGPCRFVEMGPGKVLTGLVKRIATDPVLHSVESVEDIRALEKALNEEV